MGGSALCVIFSSDTNTDTKRSNSKFLEIEKVSFATNEIVMKRKKKKSEFAIKFHCENVLQCCADTLPAV